MKMLPNDEKHLCLLQFMINFGVTLRIVFFLDSIRTETLVNIKNFFSKCDQTRRIVRISSHFLRNCAKLQIYDDLFLIYGLCVKLTRSGLKYAEETMVY